MRRLVALAVSAGFAAGARAGTLTQEQLDHQVQDGVLRYRHHNVAASAVRALKERYGVTEEELTSAFQRAIVALKDSTNHADRVARQNAVASFGGSATAEQLLELAGDEDEWCAESAVRSYMDRMSGRDEALAFAESVLASKRSSKKAKDTVWLTLLNEMTLRPTQADIDRVRASVLARELDEDTRRYYLHVIDKTKPKVITEEKARKVCDLLERRLRAGDYTGFADSLLVTWRPGYAESEFRRRIAAEALKADDAAVSPGLKNHYRGVLRQLDEAAARRQVEKEAQQ